MDLEESLTGGLSLQGSHCPQEHILLLCVCVFVDFMTQTNTIQHNIA